MSYRIMEIAQRTCDSLDNAVEVACYDSAYSAMEHMRRAFVTRGDVPPPWYLIDLHEQTRRRLGGRTRRSAT